MNVIIENEEYWRGVGRGRKLDVLRAYLLDKQDYLEILRYFFLSVENTITDDCVDLYVEYAEPDPEFPSNSIVLLNASFVNLESVIGYPDIASENIHLVISAEFTDPELVIFPPEEEDYYCAVRYNLQPLLEAVPLPDRLGLVIELYAGTD